MRSLFMMLDPSGKHFCSVHSTKDSLKFINPEDEVDLIDAELVTLANIQPIRSNTGHIYFVEKELRTQNSYVVELTVTFDEKYKEWRYSRRRVFRVLSDVHALQLVRDSQQANDYDY